VFGIKANKKNTRSEGSLLIKGLQKTTLLDYPEKVASIIFTGGCNFNCDYCYNKDLPSQETISEKSVLEFLKKRKHLIEGVVVTGGEPTINDDLPDFIKKVKAIGLLVKLDTNGTNPKMLKQLIDDKLIDYVAMDIKCSKEKYELVAGVLVDVVSVDESVSILKNSGIDYEFRTTCTPDMNEEDFEKIGKWIEGSKRYFLQRLYNTTESLEEYKKITSKYVDIVEVRR